MPLAHTYLCSCNVLRPIVTFSCAHFAVCLVHQCAPVHNMSMHLAAASQPQTTSSKLCLTSFALSKNPNALLMCHEPTMFKVGRLGLDFVRILWYTHSMSANTLCGAVLCRAQQEYASSRRTSWQHQQAAAVACWMMRAVNHNIHTSLSKLHATAGPPAFVHLRSKPL